MFATLQHHWRWRPQRPSNSLGHERSCSSWRRLGPDDRQLIGAAEEPADWTCWHFSEFNFKKKTGNVHIRQDTGRLAANKHKIKLHAYIYQYVFKWYNDGVCQHVPHLNAKPVRNVKRASEISDLGHGSILSLSQKWTVHVACLFQKLKNTFDGRIFMQGCLKKTAIGRIFVGYLFWPQMKKILLLLFLLDTSLQLS